MKVFFSFANSVDPGETQHYAIANIVDPYEMQNQAAFYQGLDSLQKYSFRGFPNTKG